MVNKEYYVVKFVWSNRKKTPGFVASWLSSCICPHIIAYSWYCFVKNNTVNIPQPPINRTCPLQKRVYRWKSSRSYQKNAYPSCLEDWKKRWYTCIIFAGNYLERNKINLDDELNICQKKLSHLFFEHATYILWAT